VGLYKRRHKIENIFRRLKHWHRHPTLGAKGGLGSKLHTVCDGLGRPVRLLLTAGNVSDMVGAGELLKDLPEANYLLADKGYDAHWFRARLRQRGAWQQITCPLRCFLEAGGCIPSISSRKVQQPYNMSLYKRRHKIENIFHRLKHWALHRHPTLGAKGGPGSKLHAPMIAVISPSFLTYLLLLHLHPLPLFLLFVLSFYLSL
jgi:transposase